MAFTSLPCHTSLFLVTASTRGTRTAASLNWRRWKWCDIITGSDTLPTCGVTSSYDVTSAESLTSASSPRASDSAFSDLWPSRCAACCPRINEDSGDNYSGLGLYVLVEQYVASKKVITVTVIVFVDGRRWRTLKLTVSIPCSFAVKWDKPEIPSWIIQSPKVFKQAGLELSPMPNILPLCPLCWLAFWLVFVDTT